MMTYRVPRHLVLPMVPQPLAVTQSRGVYEWDYFARAKRGGGARSRQLTKLQPQHPTASTTHYYLFKKCLLAFFFGWDSLSRDVYRRGRAPNCVNNLRNKSLLCDKKRTAPAKRCIRETACHKNRGMIGCLPAILIEPRCLFVETKHSGTGNSLTHSLTQYIHLGLAMLGSGNFPYYQRENPGGEHAD